MKAVSAFFFDPAGLDRLAEMHGPRYRSADPFPHCVIDGLFPENVLDEVLREIPAPGSPEWKHYDNEAERKLEAHEEASLGPATRHVVAQLNSSTFLSFLEQLTGIDGLVPDPHLWGGGLHQIEPGGFLKVHADFNWYHRLRLDRRLNLLLFLNRDWREEYGGALELWNRDMSECRARILPVFNRCVLFDTTDFAYHGHPDPLRCPQGMTRKSLALYYYSNGRPAGERGEKHTTAFQKRPGEDFRDPVEELEREKRRRSKRRGFRDVARLFVPPIVVETVRRLRERGRSS